MEGFEKEFADAFDSEEGLGPENQDTEDAEDTKETDGEPSAEQEADDAEDTGPEEETGEAEEADEQAQDEGEVPEEDKPRYKSWEGRLRKREQELKAREDELRRQYERAEKPAEEKQESPEQGANVSDIVPEEYQDDAAQLVTKHPDLAPFVLDKGPMGESIREVLYESGPVSAAALARIAQQSVAQQVVTQRLEQVQRQTLQEKHYATIEAAHPDYVEIASSEDLSVWIEEQPRFLANAYKQVVSSGSAEDVVELLSAYKAARNKGAPQKQHPENGSGAAKKKAQAAATVKSRPGPPPKGQPDKNDFAAAWDEFEPQL